MSLEGNLRDLQLQEVLQLLTHGRKGGQLLITAQLAGLAAVVCFDRGATVDAMIAPMPFDFASITKSERTRAQVESAVLELLTWRDGFFQFVAAPLGAEPHGSVRLSTEMLLVEGARRIEGWARIADKIPHARMVPAFVTAEPTHLPLLHLVPQQWEVLTQVDGQRDLPTLAESLNKDLLEIAEIVYGLIEAGLLTLVDNARRPRSNKTPLSTARVVLPPASPSLVRTHSAEDVWVPQRSDGHAPNTQVEDEGYDAIFDPVRIGVITPEGLPRLRTPLHNAPIVRPLRSSQQMRKAGDDALRRGDLGEAILQWSACVKSNEPGKDADHAREAIALATRLKEMLNSRANS